METVPDDPLDEFEVIESPFFGWTPGSRPRIAELSVLIESQSVLWDWAFTRSRFSGGLCRKLYFAHTGRRFLCGYVHF